jgi:hypothetical protein
MTQWMQCELEEVTWAGAGGGSACYKHKKQQAWSIGFTPTTDIIAAVLTLVRFK